MFGNLKLSGRAILCTITFTAKTKCRKFETNIPRKGISGPQYQFPMCLWANYIFPRWVCLFCWSKKNVDWSWEYINRSKTHECGNWGWSRAIPRKGICKRNCRCSELNKIFLGPYAANVKNNKGKFCFLFIFSMWKASKKIIELLQHQTFVFYILNNSKKNKSWERSVSKWEDI